MPSTLSLPMCTFRLPPGCKSLHISDLTNFGCLQRFGSRPTSPLNRILNIEARHGCREGAEARRQSRWTLGSTDMPGRNLSRSR